MSLTFHRPSLVRVIRGQSKNNLMNWAMVLSFYSDPEYSSTNPKDMDLPGLKLHELGGRRKGIWSVWVSGNWRITFCFKDKDAVVVDYEDYH